LKTKIVRIRLFKWKNHVNKILSKLSDVGDALSRSCNTNHAFGWMNCHFSDLTELFHEMMKQRKCLLRFSVKEIV